MDHQTLLSEVLKFTWNKHKFHCAPSPLCYNTGRDRRQRKRAWDDSPVLFVFFLFETFKNVKPIRRITVLWTVRER